MIVLRNEAFNLDDEENRLLSIARATVEFRRHSRLEMLELIHSQVCGFWN